MISAALKKRFESVIEINNVSWNVIDNIVKKDANILRPIKGIAFEEYLKKIIRQFDSSIPIRDGVGDSDVDLYVNNIAIQAKTQVTSVTRPGVRIGVALHKTHGDETTPNNLYSTLDQTFDVLCIQHPVKGVLIVPFNQIPTHGSWPNRLADPAFFNWNSQWTNRWNLLKINVPCGVEIDKRSVPKISQLPFLSSQTYLEDYEIIEMLCKPEYFRAAVMGLKGNLKEEMFINHLKTSGYNVDDNTPTYSPYDLLVKKPGKQYRVQVKGTSKNMCSLAEKRIGTEVMGTHGQFPSRGYNRSSIDYVAIIISQEQLPKHHSVKDINFIVLPAGDLPLHYLIGHGKAGVLKGFGNEKWNLPQYSDVLYPDIKLKFSVENDQIVFRPSLSDYKKYKCYNVIPLNSEFRKPHKYILNAIPNEWK